MDNRGFAVQFLTFAKDFPVLERVPGAKRPGCDSDYSPQSNTEVMNVWAAHTPALTRRDTFTFTYFY